MTTPPPPPPASPPPPPSGPSQTDDTPAPATTGMSTGAKVAIGLGVAFLGLLVLGVLAAIAIPAFLSQEDQAMRAEADSVVRNAALEVEAAAAATGGDYSAIPDLLVMVDEELAQLSDGRVALDHESTLTYVAPSEFAICAEHIELPGSSTYRSTDGMRLYSPDPCP